MLRKKRQPSGELDALLGSLVDKAIECWPQVAYDPELFIRDLARRVPVDTHLEAYLDTLSVADLYLACACAQGNSEAIRAFDNTYLPRIDQVLARLNAQPDDIDEVKQILRERFLVAKEGSASSIASYAGRGSLAGWVRVCALREFYGLSREQSRWKQVEEADLLELPSGDDDPEIGYLKKRYGSQLRAAVAQAMVSLSTRQRNVLRHHHLDCMDAGQIAQLYRVHRVTAARWLAKARRAVASGTRRAMVAHLRVDQAEYNSLLRLIQSQMDVSMRTYLELYSP